MFHQSYVPSFAYFINVCFLFLVPSLQISMQLFVTSSIFVFRYFLFSTLLSVSIFVQQDATYLLSYLLTPWCRVLLEKLTGLQLVKKFPAFYGTRRFITAFTSFHHPSLSWAIPIQSTSPQPTSWRCIVILSTHLRLGLPSGLFPSGFSTRTLCFAGVIWP